MGKISVVAFLIYSCFLSFAEAAPISATVMNDPPVASNDFFNTMEDVSLSGNNILMNDSDLNGDVLTVTQFVLNAVTYPISAGSSASANVSDVGTITIHNNGNFEYTPAANFNGSVPTITYTVSDGNGGTATATLVVTVTPLNDPPTANAQLLLVKKNSGKPVTLMGSDVEGDELSFVVEAVPLHGDLTGTAPSFTYTPDLNYTGSDSFTFKAYDGSTYSGVETVTITVESINRYMVFFTDKNGTPYSISNPSEFLSERSVTRRETLGISVVEEDLPVAPEYVQALTNEDATVLFKTKWMNGALVECTNSIAGNIENLPFVSSVEYVAPNESPTSSGRMAEVSETSDAAASTTNQLSMLNIDQMHLEGYKGEGVLMAIMDAGFPGADTISYFKHVFDEGRIHIDASYDFVFGMNNVFNHYTKAGQRHGTRVWSTIAGYKRNVFVGGAHKAEFVLFVTEDVSSEYRVEEYNWLFAAERADSLGVDVINTSLSYNIFSDSQMSYSKTQMDGETAVITRASSIASNKGIAVVVSAGNEGTNSSWKIITAPADGKQVLAVGAVTSTGTLAAISSIGPSADGRTKPDVVAQGIAVSIVDANGTLDKNDGTSFAAPLVASLVAGYRQKYPALSVQHLLDTVRYRGHQVDAPDNFMGYGIPTFYGSIITAVPDPMEDKLRVYPNPVTNNKVWIELLGTNFSEPSILLIDAKGATQIVQADRVNQNIFSLDVSSQKQGVYLLKINQGNTLITRKIIKLD